MARALRAWAINRGGKNSVRNLRYGPRTRLVRGMYAREVGAGETKMPEKLFRCRLDTDRVREFILFISRSLPYFYTEMLVLVLKS